MYREDYLTNSQSTYQKLEQNLCEILLFHFYFNALHCHLHHHTHFHLSYHQQLAKKFEFITSKTLSSSKLVLERVSLNSIMDICCWIIYISLLFSINWDKSIASCWCCLVSLKIVMSKSTFKWMLYYVINWSIISYVVCTYHTDTYIRNPQALSSFNSPTRNSMVVIEKFSNFFLGLDLRLDNDMTAVWISYLLCVIRHYICSMRLWYFILPSSLRNLEVSNSGWSVFSKGDLDFVSGPVLNILSYDPIIFSMYLRGSYIIINYHLAQNRNPSEMRLDLISIIWSNHVKYEIPRPWYGYTYAKKR